MPVSSKLRKTFKSLVNLLAEYHQCQPSHKLVEFRSFLEKIAMAFSKIRAPNLHQVVGRKVGNDRQRILGASSGQVFGFEDRWIWFTQQPLQCTLVYANLSGQVHRKESGINQVDNTLIEFCGKTLFSLPLHLSNQGSGNL